MKTSLSRKAWANLGFNMFICLCIAQAVSMRWTGLDPQSLFLDDQWVACLLKLGGPGAVLEIGAPTPLGFVLLTQGASSLSADPEWPLQVVPFACSLLLIPLMGLLAWRVTSSVVLGCLAAVILTFSPDVNLYSLRVKQYMLECAATLAILLLAERWSRTRRVREYAALAFAALVLFLFSFSAVLVGFVAVNILYLAKWKNDRTGRDRSQYLLICLGYNMVLFAAWKLLVQQQGDQAANTFWLEYFLPMDSLARAWNFFTHTGIRFFTGVLPAQFSWVVLLAPLGLGVLAFKRRTRLYGLLCGLLVAEPWVLSALHMYPVGRGRMDIFSYPATILCLVSAFLLIPGSKCRTVFSLAGTGLLCIALLDGYNGQGYHYFNNEDKSLVEYLNNNIAPQDALVIYPQAQWAVGYYGKWPITAAHTEYFNNKFVVAPVREHTLLLPGGKDGIPYLEAPEMFEPDLREFLREPCETLYFIATNQPPHVEERILSAIAKAKPVKDMQLYRARNRAVLYKIRFEQTGTAAE